MGNEDFQETAEVIPICERCRHKATSHVVDDQKRRECMEWCCSCVQFTCMMGEELFDETILIADSGTVFIRGGYGREEVWLGLSRGRKDADPDIVVRLTPLQQKRLAEAIAGMAFSPTADCWFCGTTLEVAIDHRGYVQEDTDITCGECGGKSRTCVDEDDEGSPCVSLAPVECGHGVSHDEGCKECK